MICVHQCPLYIFMNVKTDKSQFQKNEWGRKKEGKEKK